MTEEEKSLFMQGYNTPRDQLMDMSQDKFIKMERGYRRNHTGVKVIPTSEAFRKNYDNICWLSNAVWEGKG